MPSTHLQAVLPDLLGVHLRTRSGPQLGQVSLQKLLEMSKELNSVGSVRYRGRSDAAAGSCSKYTDVGSSAGFATHTRLPTSRSQQIPRTLQGLSIAPGKHLLDRLSCQTASRQPLLAFNSALQTAPANLRLQTPSSTTTTPSFQQTRLIQGTNYATEPAQQRSCKLHRSPSARPTSVSSERNLPDGSATAAGLLAHHRKRLMSADPSSPALYKGCHSGNGGNQGNLSLSACMDSVTDLSHTHSMQQVQIASKLLDDAESVPPQSSLQLMQLQPTASLSQSSTLTSATLHKHDAAELPSKQESYAPSHVSDAELGSEDSDSSSFFTDTADSGPTPCLLGLGLSGLDHDDCLSVGTSQGITDGSLSIHGDADTAEGASLRADRSSNGKTSCSATLAALHARSVSRGCP